jgi:hypothetical protein
MKINVSKCELISFNISTELGQKYASKLGCKLNYLPITYLDFLLHNKKISVTNRNFLNKKIKNKLQG